MRNRIKLLFISLLIAILISFLPHFYSYADTVGYYDEDDSDDYTDDYTDDYEEDPPKLEIHTYSWEYGSKTLGGYVKCDDSSASLNGTTVYFKFYGKKYTTRCNSEGDFRFKNLPLIKYGTSIKVYVEKNGFVSDYSMCTISIGYTSDIWHYYSYPNSNTQRGYITTAHRGDILKVTIGGKVYKKKIKNNRSRINYSFKTGSFPVGTTIRFQLITNYGKKLVDYKDIVYKKNKIYVGDSKEDVLLTAGFRNPSRKTYTTYGETWWYGKYKYVSFDSDGKVWYWYL